MHRFDVPQFSQPIVPTSGGELYCRSGVGLTRVGVTNVAVENSMKRLPAFGLGANSVGSAKVSVARRKLSGMVNRQER
jgi:hypothetical protein